MPRSEQASHLSELGLTADLSEMSDAQLGALAEAIGTEQRTRLRGNPNELDTDEWRQQFRDALLGLGLDNSTRLAVLRAVQENPRAFQIDGRFPSFQQWRRAVLNGEIDPSLSIWGLGNRRLEQLRAALRA